ncbi:MAG: deoxyribodipyrimidine photolyase [Acidobacteriota bacterium]
MSAPCFVMVPEIRVRRLNDAPENHRGAIVLYWMIAYRRLRHNFALERAADHARRLGRPLVILEALRLDHPWASRRFHQFVIDGMRDNADAAARAGVAYHPYVEPARRAGRGLLAALAEHAAVVVTDDFPAFFIPRMTEAAARRLPVRLEAVDGNGLLPMRAVDRIYPTAYAFRRALQQALPAHLAEAPAPNPLKRARGSGPWQLPAGVARQWPSALDWLDRGGSLEQLAIDQRVQPTGLTGGAKAARRRLDAFLEDFPRYGTARNEPDDEVTSRLSPYLHWGHISAHEIFQAVMAREGWLGTVSAKATGAREGWWGASPATEAFLDQLVTWRELGFNMTSRRDDYDTYDSLPDWARETLDEHADDPRDPAYDLDTLRAAETHDPLWNAAQRQLMREGRMHNYLRMLWGKKILEWSASPREALSIMIELNNTYALDGRDPNSYSGICWVLGRYDRAWGPERPIFGKIRYMSSENTARKLRVTAYLQRWSP